MPRRSAHNAIDWAAIERQFRLGQKTNKQLAYEFKVSESQIGRKAKAGCWVPDRVEDVAALTSALLEENRNAIANATPTDFEVQVAARTNADVVFEHRAGLARLRALRDKLLHEVEAITDNLAQAYKLAELTRNEDARGHDRRNDLLRRVISMPERIEATKKLAEIDERIRKGEREAFGMDKESSGKADLERLLDEVRAGISA